MPNINKQIFMQLINVFNNPGMRLDINRFIEYLDYTNNTQEDISYEEWLGSVKSNPLINIVGKIDKDIVINAIKYGSQWVKLLGGKK